MATYEMDITYKAAAEDGSDEKLTYRGYGDDDVPALRAVVADFKAGKLGTQLRLDPKLRVVDIKEIEIREV